MCRLAAYLGRARPLADVVIAPSHSLLTQSQEALEAKLAVNGDGFGVAWYGYRSDPGLFKDILPAWSDANLLNLCEHIASALFLAHVRASTEGEIARANCHPFTYDNWSFMHNGQTGSFTKLRRPLESMLSYELYERRRGATDSELFFLLLLNAGLKDNPQRACHDVISRMYDTARDIGIRPFFRLTCVFSNGTDLYCFRHASDGRCPSLYISRSFLDDSCVVASEPLDGDTAQWDEVVPDQLVCINRCTSKNDFGSAEGLSIQCANTKLVGSQSA